MIALVLHLERNYEYTTGKDILHAGKFNKAICLNTSTSKETKAVTCFKLLLIILLELFFFWTIFKVK